MAILSTLVASQWDRSAGEHGSMYGKQLLYVRFLAKLAPFVQSMDSAVIRFPSPSNHPLMGGRYIYVPLGGTKNVVIATTLIFTFVALWHDLSFRLLAWGWLVSVFILPELLAATLLPQSRVRFHFSMEPPMCHHCLFFTRSVRTTRMVPAYLCMRRRYQRSDNDRCKPCRLCHWDGWDLIHGQSNHGKCSR